MDYADYYKILGINKTATAKEIKNAYRKLARKLHPDLNPNDKDAKRNFQQINEANEVLSDPEKRRKYDQYGNDWKHAAEYEQSEKRREQPSDGRRTRSSAASPEGDYSDFFQIKVWRATWPGRRRQVELRWEGFFTGFENRLNGCS